VQQVVGAARRVLKEAAAFALRRSGAAALARRTYARDKVAILVYHDPKPATLERHLRYLSPRYALITLDRLVEAATGGAWASLPPRSLIVTFDDGHAGNADLLEVFRGHGVRPTIYACSQIVGTRRPYWWTLDRDRERLKRLPNDERLRVLAERHRFVQTREASDGVPQALSREAIRRMADGVDFGSHTRFHPILPTCSAEEADAEITTSSREVEELTGRPCRHFSYPNGDYGVRELELVRRAGYASARTIEYGLNGRGCDLFRLRIAGVPDDASIDVLAAGLTGVLAVRRRLSRSSRLSAPAGRL
jgi:peptidoglycan/xylan/chitin deacetylase (PgdA/CDA1 family)